MTHSKSLTVATILQLLLSVFAIVATFPYLLLGAESVNNAGTSPPYFIVLLGFAIGLVGVVAAYGVWKRQKWAIVLTIVLRAVDGLSALPGVLFAPSAVWQVLAIGTVILSSLVIVLLLRREPRPAIA
jgi:hypothetical protein